MQNNKKLKLYEICDRFSSTILLVKVSHYILCRYPVYV